MTDICSKMLNVLSDGKPHTPEDLHKCLADDMGEINNICRHITTLKRDLVDYGRTVLQVGRNGARLYQLVEFTPVKPSKKL